MPPTHSCLSYHTARLRLRFRIRNLQSLRQRGVHSTRSLHNRQHVVSQSLYFDSSLPTVDQSAAATTFFLSHRPRKAWVANEWRKQVSVNIDSNNEGAIPRATMLTPEIAFLGRSNTGKSSLLNALLLDPLLCRVGPKPGKTITMHAWALARSNPKTGGALKGTKGDTEPKLTVLDMPGYGHGSRDEWGNEIVKYLKNRRQLKRAFVLLNPKHGIKESDTMILDLLRRSGISHQLVACKCDGLKNSELKDALLSLRNDVREREAEMRKEGSIMGLALDDVLAVGKLGDGKMNKRLTRSKMLGVDEVRWAVLRAVGLDGYALKMLRESRQKERDVRLQNGYEEESEEESFGEEVELQNERGLQDDLIRRSIPVLSDATGRRADVLPS